MARYKNFTGNTTDTILLRKYVDKIHVSRISIACKHDTVDLIVDRLYLDDGTTEYDIIANVKVPVGATLVLDNNITYDYKVFDLKITTTNASNCTIIIN
jgi:hypothetical protein